MARCYTLEGKAYLGHLIEIRRIESCYARALVGRGLQDALGLQNLEGFAHRHATDVELPGDIGFDQALPGLQHALGYCVHQDIGHRVGKRARAVIGCFKGQSH
jgi:hypothetical protein